MSERSEPMMPRFDVGQNVRVLDLDVNGHVRTPAYVRGRAGTIERFCGAFKNPEEKAYGKSGEPRKQLFRVRFRQADLWPDYAGAPGDTVDVEIFEHWLGPA